MIISVYLSRISLQGIQKLVQEILDFPIWKHVNLGNFFAKFAHFWGLVPGTLGLKNYLLGWAGWGRSGWGGGRNEVI